MFYEERERYVRKYTTRVLRKGELVISYELAKLVSYYVERALEIAKLEGEEHLETLKEWMYDDSLAESVFEEAKKRYADKPSGYVKITKLNKLKFDG